MTWLNRLRDAIELTSPNGSDFTALWRNDTRDMSKKLGIFEIPERRGAIVQDLDVGAVTLPISIYFDGPDNDTESDRFFNACGERGTWTVIHPTKGALNLQLVSVSEQDDPVENGNYTRFDTQWIQPGLDVVAVSAAQVSQNVMSGIDTLNDTSEGQFEAITSRVRLRDADALKLRVQGVLSTFTRTMTSLSDVASDISAQVRSVQNGIRNSISQITVPITELAGQIQALVMLPTAVSNDLTFRITAFTDFIADIIGADVEGTGQDNINRIAVNELTLVTAVAALAEIAVTSELQTRAEAISVIETLAEQSSLVTDYLDAHQENFDTQDVDNQYFSQSQSYSDTISLLSNAARFLLIRSFDLTIEKRFILTRDEAPIITTIKEYGTLGPNDANFDFFISTNDLTGNEIMLMTAGREVVVYV